MSQEAMSQLADRWINDPAIRERSRAHHGGTVPRSEAQSATTELEALRWNEDIVTKKEGEEATNAFAKEVNPGVVDRNRNKEETYHEVATEAYPQDAKTSSLLFRFFQLLSLLGTAIFVYNLNYILIVPLTVACIIYFLYLLLA